MFGPPFLLLCFICFVWSSLSVRSFEEEAFRVPKKCYPPLVGTSGMSDHHLCARVTNVLELVDVKGHNEYFIESLNLAAIYGTRDPFTREVDVPISWTWYIQREVEAAGYSQEVMSGHQASWHMLPSRVKLDIDRNFVRYCISPQSAFWALCGHFGTDTVGGKKWLLQGT